MTSGPEAYIWAANLAGEAYKRLSEGEEDSVAARVAVAQVYTTLAQVYTTLAQAAAIALGEHGAGGREWRDATTKASGMPEP